MCHKEICIGASSEGVSIGASSFAQVQRKTASMYADPKAWRLEIGFDCSIIILQIMYGWLPVAVALVSNIPHMSTPGSLTCQTVCVISGNAKS